MSPNGFAPAIFSSFWYFDRISFTICLTFDILITVVESSNGRHTLLVLSCLLVADFEDRWRQVILAWSYPGAFASASTQWVIGPDTGIGASLDIYKMLKHHWKQLEPEPQVPHNSTWKSYVSHRGLQHPQCPACKSVDTEELQYLGLLCLSLIKYY